MNSRGCAEPTSPAVTPRSRGHDCPPRRQRSRVWMIALQLLITHQAASYATHCRHMRQSCWCPSGAPTARRM